MHVEPGFNATYAAWWASQPPPADVLSPEMVMQDIVAQLQSPWLVGRAGLGTKSRATRHDSQ